MMTKETYLEMKKLVVDYENEQLNKHNNIERVQQPYLELEKVTIKFKYNPHYGDDRVCKCGHVYYRHFDSYENMATVGCKYCGCHHFEEVKRL